jgi:hypothetical protein
MKKARRRVAFCRVSFADFAYALHVKIDQRRHLFIGCPVDEGVEYGGADTFTPLRPVPGSRDGPQVSAPRPSLRFDEKPLDSRYFAIARGLGEAKKREPNLLGSIRRKRAVHHGFSRHFLDKLARF